MINYDFLRQMLGLLTFLIIIVMFMNNCNLLNKNYLFIISLILFLLIICFFVDNLLYIYVFFEFSIMPLLILIILKGGSIERLLANVYLLIYTLLGSFYFLLVLLIIKSFLRVRLKFYFNFYLTEKGIL